VESPQLIFFRHGESGIWREGRNKPEETEIPPDTTASSQTCSDYISECQVCKGFRKLAKTLINKYEEAAWNNIPKEGLYG
jgi:hypothetical protein